MVFGPISRYSLVNAKVRARLGRLLPVNLVERLSETREPTEFYAALSGTVYEPVFANPEIDIDPRIAEKLLLEKEIEWHAELLQDLKGEVRELVAHFLEKYEIENIKTVLRTRGSRSDRENIDYIARGKLPHAIPYKGLAEADTIEEAVNLLAGTPYVRPAMEALEDYHEKKTLFPIETALEIDYYTRLKEKVSKLSGRDRKVAENLIGIEIDQKNIEWLIRLKFYYDIPVADLLDYNIPGGKNVDRSRLIKVFQSESVETVLAVALEQFFGRAAEFFASNPQAAKLYVLEIILWNYLVSEARKVLGGFPFTIGTVLAYLILKRAEIRNLITILNGKILGMKKDEIEGHLRVMF